MLTVSGLCCAYRECGIWMCDQVARLVNKLLVAQICCAGWRGKSVSRSSCLHKLDGYSFSFDPVARTCALVCVRLGLKDN